MREIADTWCVCADPSQRYSKCDRMCLLQNEPPCIKILWYLITLLAHWNWMKGDVHIANLIMLFYCSDLISLHVQKNNTKEKAKRKTLPPPESYTIYMRLCMFSTTMPTWIQTQISMSVSNCAQNAKQSTQKKDRIPSCLLCGPASYILQMTGVF